MNTTSTGEAVISTAKLNNAVNALDKNGRLDLVLGRKMPLLFATLTTL